MNDKIPSYPEWMATRQKLVLYDDRERRETRWIMTGAILIGAALLAWIGLAS